MLDRKSKGQTVQNYSDNSNSDDSVVDQPLDGQDVPGADKQVFFPVSIVKLIVLDTLFFGIYAIFWMFMNWKYLNEKQGVKCLPGVRAIFAPIFFFALAPKMVEHIRKNGGKVPPLPPVALALIFFVCNFLGRFDHPVCVFLSVLSVLPLVMLQKGVIEINGGPAATTNKKFSVINWVFMVIGGLVWGLVIFGMLIKQ